MLDGEDWHSTVSKQRFIRSSFTNIWWIYDEHNDEMVMYCCCAVSAVLVKWLWIYVLYKWDKCKLCNAFFIDHWKLRSLFLKSKELFGREERRRERRRKRVEKEEERKGGGGEEKEGGGGAQKVWALRSLQCWSR